MFNCVTLTMLTSVRHQKSHSRGIFLKRYFKIKRKRFVYRLTIKLASEENTCKALKQGKKAAGKMSRSPFFKIKPTKLISMTDSRSITSYTLYACILRVKTWFELSRVKLYRNYLKGNKLLEQLGNKAKGNRWRNQRSIYIKQSYKGSEIP